MKIGGRIRIMEKNDAPVKGWRESQTSRGMIDDSLSVLLDRCIGDEVFGGEGGIGEKFGDKGRKVSIRCRRHHRRIEVPEGWLKVSDWLCPKCYEKLTPEEREVYAPKKTVYPIKDKAYRANEEGVKTATSTETETKQESPRPLALKKLKWVEMDCIYCGAKPRVSVADYFADHYFCPQCASLLSEETKRNFRVSFSRIQTRRYETIEAKYASLEQYKPVEKVPDGSSSSSLMDVFEKAAGGIKADKEQGGKSSGLVGYDAIRSNPRMSALLPRYRIVCKRCGKTVPCHKIWSANSKVLCPSCFAEMSEDEVRKFHEMHPETTAEFFEVESPSGVSSAAIPDWVLNPSALSVDDYVNGGGCSTEFIMRASPAQLAQAVKSGKLSKARARIELKRRNNAEYYNHLPDAGITIFGPEGQR